MADRRTLTLGITAILIASMLAGAGSLAYFIDIETSTGNTFIAGTFGLELTGTSLPFTTAWNIMPGWSDYENQGVENIGTVAGEVYITAENFADPTGYWGEPEFDDAEMSADDFAKILKMRICVDIDGYHNYEEIYDGPLYGMETDRFAIDPDEVIYLEFVAYLPTDLDDPDTDENEDDNLYQADGVVFDIVFYADTEITLTP